MNPKLMKNSFFNLPSVDHLPDLHNSLKLINTVNAFPQHTSFDNIELALAGTNTGEPVPDPAEDSLGERISHVPTAHSAKKKRPGCTCKKTFCLKMYCECFSSGRDCGDGCDCRSCKNTPELRQQELGKGKSANKEVGLRNCSLAEKRCNCKKSGCQKRYCECFNSGLTCSEACGCEGCRNMEPSHAKRPPLEERQEEAREEEGQAAEASEEGGALGKEEREGPELREFPSIKKCNSLDDFQQYYD